jgi:hypothetical protein
MATTTTVGSGQYTFEVDKQWGRGPGGLSEFGLVSGVAGDSQDRVYLFIRAPVAEILVLDPRGTLLGRFGAGHFVEPHMISSAPPTSFLPPTSAPIRSPAGHSTVSSCTRGARPA